MKILNFISIGRLFKWVALLVFGYAIVHAGVPPSIICLLLLIRLAVRLALHLIRFICGMIQMSIMLILIVFLYFILQSV
jgi:hypothetical protein